MIANFFHRRKLRAILRRIESDSYEDNMATLVDYVVRELITQFDLNIGADDTEHIIAAARTVLYAHGIFDNKAVITETAAFVFTAAIELEPEQ